jgi:hypothetical protein
MRLLSQQGTSQAGAFTPDLDQGDSLDGRVDDAPQISWLVVLCDLGCPGMLLQYRFMQVSRFRRHEPLENFLPDLLLTGSASA